MCDAKDEAGGAYAPRVEETPQSGDGKPPGLATSENPVDHNEPRHETISEQRQVGTLIGLRKVVAKDVRRSTAHSEEGEATQPNRATRRHNLHMAAMRVKKGPGPQGK